MGNGVQWAQGYTVRIDMSHDEHAYEIFRLLGYIHCFTADYGRSSEANCLYDGSMPDH